MKKKFMYMLLIVFAIFVSSMHAAEVEESRKGTEFFFFKEKRKKLNDVCSAESVAAQRAVPVSVTNERPMLQVNVNGQSTVNQAHVVGGSLDTGRKKNDKKFEEKIVDERTELRRGSRFFGGTSGLFRCDKMKTFIRSYFDAIRNSVIITFIYAKIIKLKSRVDWNASVAHIESVKISDLNSARDKTDALGIIKDDLNNLVIETDFLCFEDLLKNPKDQAKKYFGPACCDFRFKVLRGKDALGQDKLVGCIFYCRIKEEDWIGNKPGSSLIDLVVVSKKYRRRGYGQLLLNCAMSELKGMGAERVHLDVWNPAAVRLYKKNGFEESRRNTEYGYSVYGKSIKDFSLLAQDFGKTSGQYVGDIAGVNGIPDGVVDLYDLLEFMNGWME